jgi:hypothetical protein
VLCAALVWAHSEVAAFFGHSWACEEPAMSASEKLRKKVFMIR